MNDSLLMQSVEGLETGVFATGGEIWQRLQGEKEEVSRELLADGPLVHDDIGGPQGNDSVGAVAREIGWQHRQYLEARLRDLNDAQDRLIDGGYGRCADCDNDIDRRRLLADPAAYLCLTCQTITEDERLH